MGSGGEKATLQRRPEDAGGQLEPQPAVCALEAKKGPTTSWAELARM